MPLTSRRIDPDSDRPVYKQLADVIRGQIARGELQPGEKLPSEKDFVELYDLSRDTVRRAMAYLRTEGAIATTARGSRVSPVAERQELGTLGGLVSARMPTEEERRRLGVKMNIPVLVVDTGEGEPEVLPADRFVIRVRPARDRDPGEFQET